MTDEELEALGLKPADIRYLGTLLEDVWEGHYRGLAWIRDVPDAIPTSPRLNTPIEKLNEWTQGGVYGLTGLGGDPGAGKSLFATSVAYDAAVFDGWTVIYLAGEMTEAQMLERLLWIAAKRGHARADLEKTLRRSFFLFEMLGMTGAEGLLEMLTTALLGADKALLVVDSINSVLAKIDAPDDWMYWKRYEHLMTTLVTLRRLTEGRFSSLILSELNKEGSSKGRQLEYQADLMLNFKNTLTPRVYKVRVVKNRERGDDGSLGEFRIGDNAAFVEMGS